MTRPRLTAKIQRDLALNLTELAAASGYNRNTLARMCLPFIEGRIFYSDFRRILAQRQDAHEHSVRALFALTPNERMPASLSPASADSPRAIADRLDAPSSKRATPTASHPALQSLARSTA